MKNFDAKWQTCAAWARQTPSPPEAAPIGFATRVVARTAVQNGPVLEEIWRALIVRLLGGAVGLLLLCALMEMPHLRDRQPFEPGIENAVAQLVWSL